MSGWHQVVTKRTACSFKSSSLNEGEFSVFDTCSAFQTIYALLKMRLLLSNCTYNIDYISPAFLLVLMIYANYKNTIANIFMIILPFSLWRDVVGDIKHCQYCHCPCPHLRSHLVTDDHTQAFCFDLCVWCQEGCVLRVFCFNNFCIASNVMGVMVSSLGSCGVCVKRSPILKDTQI